MNGKTNRAVSNTMDWSVNGVVYEAVNGLVYWSMYGALGGIVGNVVHSAVYSAVHGIRQPDPEHLALQEFLYSCGTEMGTQ